MPCSSSEPHKFTNGIFSIKVTDVKNLKMLNCVKKKPHNLQTKEKIWICKFYKVEVTKKELKYSTLNLVHCSLPFHIKLPYGGYLYISIKLSWLFYVKFRLTWISVRIFPAQSRINYKLWTIQIFQMLGNKDDYLQERSYTRKYINLNFSLHYSITIA